MNKLQEAALVLVATTVATILFWQVFEPPSAEQIFWNEDIIPLPFWLHGGLSRLWFDLVGWPLLAGGWWYGYRSATSTEIKRHQRFTTPTFHAISLGLIVGLVVSGLGGLVLGLTFGLIIGPVIGILAGMLAGMLIRHDKALVVSLVVGLFFGTVTGIAIASTAVAISAHGLAGLLTGFTLLSGFTFIAGFLWGIWQLTKLLSRVRLNLTRPDIQKE